MLGHGSSSEVYVARDDKLKRDVVLKLVLESSPLRHQVVRLAREMRVLGKVTHPNILPLYAYGKHAGHTYQITAYADGGSLEDRLGSGVLPLDDALGVLRGLASALDHVHPLGVVHGDVKPANVLLTSDLQPLLADFGVARLPRRAAQETPLLRDFETLVGTPLYMAPELVRGSAASPASDLYALGVLAFQLVSGRLPFLGTDAAAVLHEHLHTEAPLLTSVAPELPRRLDAVFARALAKAPEQRWATCTELVDALAEGLAAAPAADQRPRRRKERAGALLRLLTGPAAIAIVTAVTLRGAGLA